MLRKDLIPELLRASRISAGVAPGLVDLYKEAAPVTKGVDALVPENER